MAAFKDPYADDLPGGGAFKDPYADDLAPSAVLDVAKQVPSGLVRGLEAIPAFPAKILGAVGGALERSAQEAPDRTGFSGFIQRLFRGDPEAIARREELKRIIDQNRGGGIAQYLPKAETPAGEIAGAATEFIPSFVTGGIARPVTLARDLASPAARTTAAQYVAREAPGIATRGAAGAATGAASETAGQVGDLFSPEAGAAARLTTALAAGPAATRVAERAVMQTAPVRAAARASADQDYAAFRNSGYTFAPNVGVDVAQGLKADLQSRGLTTRTADKTWGVLDDIEKQPFTDPRQFQERYKELGSVAKKATDSEERLAANIAQERLLQYIETTPQSALTSGGIPMMSAADAAATLRRANADWAAAARSENVAKRIVKAEDVAAGQHSGLGLENELRRRIGVLAESGGGPGGTRGGFTPEETALFRSFARGGNVENARRYLMNLLGGRGGIAATIVGGGAGFGLGGLGSDPITGTAYGVGAPLAGLALAKLGNRRALGRAQDIERLLMARSPYAQRAGMPFPARGSSYLPTLAPTLLSTLGEGQ